jgi:hypothetical protein
MSGGLPPDPHKPSPRNLAWAPHFTRARHRGRPQMLTPGIPPIMTPSEKPWRVKNWVGASKQKLLLGVGLPCKILFVGGSPKPKVRRVHPTKWGVCFENLAGPANKSCSSGCVCIFKFYLWGAHPNPKSAGSLDQSARDFFTMKLWNSPGQRRGAQLVAYNIQISFFTILNKKFNLLKKLLILDGLCLLIWIFYQNVK